MWEVLRLKHRKNIYIFQASHLPRIFSRLAKNGRTMPSITQELTTTTIIFIFVTIKVYKSPLAHRYIKRNIYPDLIIKMISGNKKKSISFFQISAVCIRVWAYMHATFLVGEIADRFLGRALYGQHFVADKEPPKCIFCLLLKEMWMSFDHNIV